MPKDRSSRCETSVRAAVHRRRPHSNVSNRHDPRNNRDVWNNPEWRNNRVVLSNLDLVLLSNHNALNARLVLREPNVRPDQRNSNRVVSASLRHNDRNSSRNRSRDASKFRDRNHRFAKNQVR